MEINVHVLSQEETLSRKAQQWQRHVLFFDCFNTFTLAEGEREHVIVFISS